MVNYLCEICNYTTVFSTSYKKHLNSKKHKDKESKYNEEKGMSNVSKVVAQLVTPNGNNNYSCCYCQQVFNHRQSLYRHKKTCKLKKTIEKSGLYIMWNHKMVDDENNNYYKLGRTSNRDSRLNSYASQYQIKKEDIKFLYEVEIEDEKFAEKFLFNILEEFRINKYEELFNAPFNLIKETMDLLKSLLVNYKIKKNKEIIQDNIDLIMAESDEEFDSDDEEEIKKYDKIKESQNYIKNIINGDYEMINEMKLIKKKNINSNKKFKCNYCSYEFTRKDNLNVHIKNSCKVKKELDEEKRKDEQKKEEKDLKVNKLLEEITKMREDQKKKEEEQKEREKKMLEEQTEREKKMLEEIEKLKLEKSNSTTNNTTTNNTTNNNTTNINNGTVINQLNNLNINFSNVIPMETFLYNMEHKYLIPEQDIEAILYANDNLKIDDVADRIVKTLIANCKRQVKDMGLIDDKKVLPIMPVLCTDSNLRSHKERLKDGWDTLYDDKYLDKMLSIINNRMCDLKRRVIFISKKNKNKVFSRIKKNISMGELINLQKEINGENQLINK